MDIEWKPVVQTVQWARRLQGGSLPPKNDANDNDINEVLSRRYGLDVTDPRQLYYLLANMHLYAPVLVDGAKEAHANDFYRLNELQAAWLGATVLQSSVLLILQLSEHLPVGVLATDRQRVKRTRVPDEPIDPNTLNWQGITPHSSQVERYQIWHQAVTTKETPAHLAARDQGDALLRDLYSDPSFAFTAVVACTTIVALAEGLTREVEALAEVEAESVKRFRDVVIVTAYETRVPPEFSSL